MTETAPEEKSAEVAAPSEDRLGLPRFAEHLKKLKSFEESRPLLRVMPKGIFVDERIVPKFVEIYKDWVAQETNGEVQKPLEKCHARLFGEKALERFYLVEGKVTLAGFLAAAPFTNPQATGLPYNLGSLLPSSSRLQLGDPALAQFKNIQIVTEKSGPVIEINVRRRSYRVPQKTLESFITLARDSRFLMRRYPDCTTSLVEALRVVIGVLARARPMRREFPMLVPQGVKEIKETKIYLSGKFGLVEERGKVTEIIELTGPNLSRFIRRELSQLSKQRLGSFHLADRDARNLGFFQVRGKRTFIRQRAFAEFIEYLGRAREPRERFSTWFTAEECFERFSSWYQMAQPMNPRQLHSTLKDRGIRAHGCMVYGGWTFIQGPDGSVERVVARHIRLPVRHH